MQGSVCFDNNGLLAFTYQSKIPLNARANLISRVITKLNPKPFITLNFIVAFGCLALIGECE